jgi:PAS domain S-box-containing protein
MIHINLVYSQTDDNILKITKLEKELNQAPVSEKAAILNSLSAEYVKFNPRKSKEYAEQALNFSKILKNGMTESEALFNLGESYYALSEYQSSVDNYTKALDYWQLTGNDTMQAKIYKAIGFAFAAGGNYISAKEYLLKALDLETIYNRNQHITTIYFKLGRIFYAESNYQKALYYLKKSLEFVEGPRNSSVIAEINNNLGILFYDLGSYEQALEYYLTGLQTYESINNRQGVANILNNIGIVYYDWGSKEKALEYYQKSMKIEEELQNNQGVADSYNNIGIIYSDWGQNELAIDYYQKAIAIYDEHADNLGKAQALNNMGESYMALNQFEKALEYLLQSLEMEKKFANKPGITQSYLSIAKLYFNMGNIARAEDYNRKSFEMADSLNLSYALMSNYELFYKISSNRKDYKKALDNYIQYSRLNDSIYSKQFVNKLAEIEAKYQIEKEEREKDLMIREFSDKEKEVRTQRIYLIIIFVLMIIFGFLVYYDTQSKIKANNKLKKINEEILSQKEKLTETLENLSKSEMKYKNLVEYSPTGIIYIDIKGKILETNRKILEILGSPNEEATRSINCLTFPPLVEIGFATDIESSIEKGDIIYNEKNYKTKWGKQVSLRYYITPVKNRLGNVANLIINVEDFTSQKKAEQSKIESEQKYRMLVENSLQAMLIIQDGKIIFANSRVEELTNYKISELSGKGKLWLKTLIFREDYRRSIDLMKEAVKETETPVKAELRFIRKDGHTRWVEILGSQVEYLGHLAILVVAIDITERKEAEQVLIESGKQLKKANAMKDKFFSIIAHDLKNPFNAILGFSNLLFEAYDNFDENQRKTFIRNICDASENTFKLLQNLLEWSTTQTGKIEYNPVVLNIKMLTEENIRLFKSNAENKRIKVISNLYENTIVYADENMIKAVIRNLLSNAIKFTGRGGIIEISATNSGDMVEVCIADNGVGIDPRNLKKLFRIDDQFKNPGTENELGSGLGLILCREFVEKNKGEIWAESQPGRGSKFKFKLPAGKPIK